MDEAHKMSAATRDKKTLAYKLGEQLSQMTDHFLLMTATPHKGDPDHFCLFLELLDRDVYGDVKSLEEAMKRQEAPFYLRRVKEALVSFPDLETGKSKQLFTKRFVKTTEFKISEDGPDSEWEFYDAQIHGGMKIGDRDTPGTRIFAERDFRECAQVLVATEAAGEGINLQFCWFMINYDIPWNPVRLEQRMGRIHRYGQEKDCLIFNFVSTNTREGRVLQKLFERIKAIEEDLDPRRTGKVFNVLGDVFPANLLEKMIRDMYAHNQMDEEIIKQRIVEQVDKSRFERITNSTLERLAKRELNLSAIVGKSAEAKERRLVPEVIENFFIEAAPIAGVQPKEIRENAHIYRVGRVPRPLWPIGERLEPRFGKLGREYKNVVFDKELLKKDTTLEWVTPGHPLFEAVREDVTDQTSHDLQRGSVFYDLNCKEPYRLDFFAASIKDGRDH